MTTVLAAALLGGAVAIAFGWQPVRRPLPGLVAARVERRPWPWWPAALPGLGSAPLIGPVGAAVAAVLGVLALRAWRARALAGAAAAERAGAVEALAVLASELRAGRPPPEALAAAAAVASGGFSLSLAVAARTFALGGDPVAALRADATSSCAPEALRGLAACVEVCASSGASLALAVDTVSEALRADQVQRLRVEAELAGPRATAVLLAALPVAGTLLAAGLGARPLHVLLRTSVGEVCLVIGVVLDVLGLWWTARLVAGATP